MTTLAVMKADIADDFARGDLTDAIAAAISRAIAFYQRRRFWFNESRDLTFDTIIGQSRYSASDDTDIPLFYALDGMFITVSGQNRCLNPITVQQFELWNDNSAATGEPFNYCRFDEGIGLYPIPGAVYTVRPIGHVRVAEPATDGETDNPWMTDAYELVRSYAAMDVAATKVRDYDYARAMREKVTLHLAALTDETSKRKATGNIRATTF